MFALKIITFSFCDVHFLIYQFGVLVLLIGQ